MTPFRLAALDLTRKRGSTVIALLSIALCVTCGSILMKLSVVSASRFATMVNGPEAVIGAKAGGIEILLGSLNLEGPYPDFIPEQLYETLGQTIHFDDGTVYNPSVIRTVVPLVLFGKFHERRVFGTNQNFFQQPERNDRPQLLDGRWFGPGQETIVGIDVATKEGIMCGDTISVRSWTSKNNSRSEELRLHVVGVFQCGKSVWNQACFSSLAEAQRVFRAFGDTGQSLSQTIPLHYVLAYIHPGGFNSVARLINRRSVAELISVAQQRANLDKLTGAGMKLGLFMTTLVLLLSGLSVAGVMMSRFEGMIVQIAVLRAIGFSRMDLGRWLLWEGALLGLASCALGAVLETALFPLVGTWLGSVIPPESVTPVHFYYGAPFWVASFVGVLFAVVVPLIRIVRQDPHTSLKGL